jgi:hypothetical protein
MIAKLTPKSYSLEPLAKRFKAFVQGIRGNQESGDSLPFVVIWNQGGIRGQFTFWESGDSLPFVVI